MVRFPDKRRFYSAIDGTVSQETINYYVNLLVEEHVGLRGGTGAVLPR